MSSACPVCGLVPTIRRYCVVVDDLHTTFETTVRPFPATEEEYDNV